MNSNGGAREYAELLAINFASIAPGPGSEERETDTGDARIVDSEDIRITD